MSKFEVPKNFYNIYSSYEQSSQVIKYFKTMFGNGLKNYTITDGTAGIGGNSKAFCNYFGFVNCIEIDKDTCKVLNKNLKQFENKSIINGNYIELFTRVKQDIVFLDPPWGNNYKTQSEIKLYLNDYDLNHLISTLYYYASLVILKAPNNYIINKVNKWKIKKFPIENDKKVLYNVLFYYK